MFVRRYLYLRNDVCGLQDDDATVGILCIPIQRFFLILEKIFLSNSGNCVGEFLILTTLSSSVPHVSVLNHIDRIRCFLYLKRALCFE